MTLFPGVTNRSSKIGCIRTILTYRVYPRGWVLLDGDSLFKGVGFYLDQIWTTATQLTTTSYNKWQQDNCGDTLHQKQAQNLHTACVTSSKISETLPLSAEWDNKC